mgnify:CR=1 FL=1
MAEQKITSGSSWKKHPILVVDDEKGVVDTIRLALKLEGFNCQTAMSGEAALLVLKEHPARLVISDYSMAPGMNGVEFLTKVKERYPDTVTMMLSAHSESQIILDAVNKAGAFQYLVKPYTEEELILRVSQALQYYHAQDEVRKLAMAKQKLLKRMALQENASIMGSFSKALSEKFSDTVTELIWGATQETLGMRVGSGSTDHASGNHSSKRVSRLHLATILKKLSRVGHYSEFTKFGKFQPVSISEFLGELLDQAKFAAAHAGIDLKIHEDFGAKEGRPCEVNMLPDLLSLGIRAVIENAIIHRGEANLPCELAVITKTRQGDDGQVVDIDFRDNGQGVHDLADDIFSPLITSITEQSALGAKFPKLSEYNFSDVGHVGLGLTLARWAITKHNGDIQLVESRSTGSLFRITLPTA